MHKTMTPDGFAGSDIIPLAPVAFFAFNRPDHTLRSLTALAANELAQRTDLYVFCDGPRSEADVQAVEEVRRICRAASGFASVSIKEQESNIGLRRSVISGVDFVFSRHESIIVFEDDVLASPRTLWFLNICLEKYRKEPAIFNVSAWSPSPEELGFPQDYPWDVYFIPRFNCWGWGTWQDRWQGIDWSLSVYPDFSGDIYAKRAFCAGGCDMPPMLQACVDNGLDSWACPADFSRFSHGRLGVNPIRSYVDNIGLDRSGTHCGETPQYKVDIGKAPENPVFPEYIFVSDILYEKYHAFFSKDHPLPVPDGLMAAETGSQYHVAANGDPDRAAAVALQKAAMCRETELKAEVALLRSQLDLYTQSKIVQGVVQLKDIVNNRDWAQLPGWLWRAVRFMGEKVLGGAGPPPDIASNPLREIDECLATPDMQGDGVPSGTENNPDAYTLVHSQLAKIQQSGAHVLVNLGCGARWRPDWINIDFHGDNIHVFQHNLLQGVPLPDASADGIYLSHCLEHFAPQDAEAFLRECCRALKPSGILRVVVPDLEQVARFYLTEVDAVRANPADEVAPARHEWMIVEIVDQLCRHQSGGEMLRLWARPEVPAEDFILGRLGTEYANARRGCKGVDVPPSPVDPLAVGEFRLSGEPHQWMYDEISLSRLLRQCGFQSVRRVDATASALENFAKYYLDTNEDGSAYKPDSLYMEALRLQTRSGHGA